MNKTSIFSPVSGDVRRVKNGPRGSIILIGNTLIVVKGDSYFYTSKKKYTKGDKIGYVKGDKYEISGITFSYQGMGRQRILQGIKNLGRRIDDSTFVEIMDTIKTVGGSVRQTPRITARTMMTPPLVKKLKRQVMTPTVTPKRLFSSIPESPEPLALRKLMSPIQSPIFVPETPSNIKKTRPEAKIDRKESKKSRLPIVKEEEIKKRLF